MVARRDRLPPAWATTGVLSTLLLALALSACDSLSRGPHDSRFYAFGTVIEVTLDGLSARDASLTSGRLQERFDRWHRQWHPLEGDDLAALNRTLAQGEAATVSSDLAALLAHARALTIASDGLFDPGIGGLIRLWGFHRGEIKPQRAAPANIMIERWLDASPSLAALEIDGDRVSAPSGALQIDLGGFAKGVAVARAMKIVRDSGAESGLVNAGGDLAVMGRPAERPWRIGLRSADGDGVLAALTLEGGEAAFTSGDYERDFSDGVRRYHHLLDPRTGRPATGVRSVTVIHEDPVLADVAATALFIAGPEAWPDTARRLGVSRALVLDTDGRLQMTAPMSERVQILRDPTPPIHVLDLADRASEPAPESAESDTE